MQGTDSEREPPASPREPAPVLCAWIQELLAGLHERQVRRLEQLRERLEGEIFAWDNSALAQGLRSLYSGGRELHFVELRTSWLQRMLGRHRAAFHRFAAAVDRMEQCANTIKADAKALASHFGNHDQAARRLFVELELECNELGEELDRGVTWLQQMCEDISSQRKQGSTEAQLVTLAEKAQSQTQAFKHLQSISSMVRDIGVRGQAILARRAALVEQARADMEAFEKRWSLRVGEIAGAVRAGHTSLPGIAKAVEAHDQAMKHLEAALDACGALQGEEAFMAEQLDALRATLAGRPAD